jgi:xylan 1,4-beta-xylosidase
MDRSYNVLVAMFLLLPLHDVRGEPRSTTFCNPLNLNYGFGARGHRSSADPVIVLFKNRYYPNTTAATTCSIRRRAR